MSKDLTSQQAYSVFAASRDPDYQALAAPHLPDAAAFFARWQERAAQRDIVIGQDLPSRPFARYLANLMIVEPIDQDRDCRIRLAGSLLRQRYGREVSGERLSALFSQRILAENLARMRQVRQTGIPIILAASIARDDAPPLSFESVILRARMQDERAACNVIGVFVDH